MKQETGCTMGKPWRSSTSSDADEDDADRSAIFTNSKHNNKIKKPSEISPASFHAHNHGNSCVPASPGLLGGDRDRDRVRGRIHISSTPRHRDALRQRGRARSSAASPSSAAAAASSATATVPSSSNVGGGGGNSHGSGARMAVEDNLRRVLTMASDRVRTQRLGEVTSSLRLRRAAHRDLTSLRVFPLQEPALRELDDMIGRCGGRNEGREGGGTTRPTAGDAAVAELECHYPSDGDSSGVSTSSVDEPKRLRPQTADNDKENRTNREGRGDRGVHVSRSTMGSGKDDGDVSPGKATARASYREEFLRDRDAVPMEPSDPARRDVLLPALWSMEPRIFAKEHATTGRRKYVVGNYGRFADHYWRRVAPGGTVAAGGGGAGRHYYELIREGSPCRLYLDMEFDRVSNPAIDGGSEEALLSEFASEMFEELEAVYGVGGLDRSCVVDLDSGTDAKFSRHWIVHLPAPPTPPPPDGSSRGEDDDSAAWGGGGRGEALFRDSAAVGVFVRNLIGRLAEGVATGALARKGGRTVLAEHLFVNAKGSKAKSTTASTSSQSQEAMTPEGRWSCAPEAGSTTEAKMMVAPQLTPKRTTCFVDLSVYTRNRLFRLLGSSKYGKPSSAALRIADANEFPFPEGFGNFAFHVPDMAAARRKKMENVSACQSRSHRVSPSSLGGDVGGESNEMVDNDRFSNVSQDEDFDVQRLRSSLDWSNHAEALAQTLVVPLNWTKLKFPILPDPIPPSDGKSGISDEMHKNNSDNAAAVSTTLTRAHCRGRSRATSMGPSPFECLDSYVTEVLGTRGGTQGEIRAWSMERRTSNRPPKTEHDADCSSASRFSLSSGQEGGGGGGSTSTAAPDFITYQMARNRWCENIGRPHRSNNVMWTVDLGACRCWQTCHDPECRGFRGRPIDLPEDVRARLKEALFDYELASIDEATLIESARAAKELADERQKAEEEEFERALLALDISGNIKK